MTYRAERHSDILNREYVAGIYYYNNEDSFRVHDTTIHTSLLLYHVVEKQRNIINCNACRNCVVSTYTYVQTTKYRQSYDNI